MNWTTRKILRKLRKLHTALYPDRHKFYLPEVDYKGQEAGDQIRNLLVKNQPCMIGRIGGSELRVIINYIDIANHASFLQKSRDYITEKRDRFWWDPEHRTEIYNFSGFFPTTDAMLSRFSVKMLDDMKQVDLLGSWRTQEYRLKEYLPPGLIRVPLGDLNSMLHKNPWSEVLAGKKVLVVHPFEESIKHQYARRKLLFQDQRVLPDFELKTLKAVQSLVGTQVKFADWFAAFDWMCDQLNKIDFDIAIIGAGAYGFPLAAHAKRMGKKAVHLGGTTQMLFGIRGKRWDRYPEYQHLFNEHWARPQTDETPTNFQLLEGGAYW
jgi:hypothetical protein